MKNGDEITLKDIIKASKLINENTPCYCKMIGELFCPKHAILRIPKEEMEKVKEVLGI